MEQEHQRMILLADLAARWGYETSTLRDPRFRRRVGLALVRISGRYIGALEADVLAIERRERDIVGSASAPAPAA